MQSIITKYLPCTNFKGSRIKATCERGSITISYPLELSGDAVHIAAADALVAKFVKEDEKRYGTTNNPWSTPRVCGQLPSGEYAHVIQYRDTVQFSPQDVSEIFFMLKGRGDSGAKSKMLDVLKCLAPDLASQLQTK